MASFEVRVRYSTVRNIDFDQLDLRLFVAGELEVVTSRDISQMEANCRLNILTDIMCAAGFYEWSAIKRLYVAIVTEVEMGIRCWGMTHLGLNSKYLCHFR